MQILNTTSSPQQQQQQHQQSDSQTTPTGAAQKQKPKRSRKQQASVTTPSTSISAIDMDDIFQSVIGVSDEEENENVFDKSKLFANHTNTNTNTNNTSNNNATGFSAHHKNNSDALPVYLNLNNSAGGAQPPPSIANAGVANPVTFLSAFDDESLSHDTYIIQENSHLIQFECCLMGCVFYIQTSETYYSQDCAADWRRVIERFGGKTVDEYYSTCSEKQPSEITHVLCSNRFSEVYKRAVEDKKRVVTPYWLEDVLQEQKLRTPWLAYHFPSPFDIKDGPLKNYVIFFDRIFAVCLINKI